MLAKVAQMLAYGDNDDDTVFSECKPFSRERTHTFVKKYIKNNTDVPFTITPIIYKSGSIGQVYKGEYKNKTIVLKFLYTGLETQTEEDLKVINMIGKFLYGNVKIKEALEEVKKKITEELDFRIECKNHMKMHSLWDNISYATVPNIYPELCKKNMLVVDHIDGITLSEFCKIATQEEKNKLSYNIVRFMYTNIYMHKILYSDCHAGNFIITKVNNEYILNVIDFGCINEISDNTYRCLKKIHKSLKCKDKPKFFKYVNKLGLLNDSVTEESKEYMYNTFCVSHKPWVEEKEFTFERTWMAETEKKNMELIRQWSIPKEMIYFNKIPYGLFNILERLNATGKYYEIFNSLLL